MAILKFGYTWWGKKWLDSLRNTDFSNRLPRGRTYARNNRVKNIKITRQGVVAKVLGSYSYKVKFNQKPFTKAEQEKIVKVIVNNFTYLSALLNHKLPSEILEEFRQENIELLPNSWQDIQADCSCPDWAECCKHIAAVIYVVVNEIDKNPFLIFQLRGLDILSALEKRGFTQVYQEQKIINPYITNVTKQPRVITTKPIWPEVEKIDFSTIPFLRELLCDLLEPKPLFYPNKDFKEIMIKKYKDLANFTEKITVRKNETTTEKFKDKIIDIEFFIDQKGQREFFIKKETITGKEEKEKIDVEILEKILLQIPYKNLVAQNPKIVSLYFLYYFVIKTLKQSAFIPELINLAENEYSIRWLPALLDEKVNKIFQIIVKTLPIDMIKLNKQTEERFLPEEMVKIIFSMFSQHIIKQYNKLKGEENYRYDKISAFFWKEEILRVEGFEQRELANTIALWINNYYIKHKKYAPLLKINEKKQGFEIVIMVEQTDKKLEMPIALKDIFEKKEYSEYRLEILKDLDLLVKYFPLTNEILKSRGEDNLYISCQDFPSIFFNYLPVLKKLGIPILLPKGLEKLVKPRVKLSAEIKKEATTSYLSLADMLKFNWQLALGEQKIDLKEFKRLIKKYKGIVKIKDKFVYVDPQDMQKILNKIESEPKLEELDKNRTIFSGEYEGLELDLSFEAQQYLEKTNSVKALACPKELKAKLRPYQQKGFEWLYRNVRLGFGSLIADDMGLGKTIQVITLLLKLAKEGKFKKNPALIVVPTTLLSNWQNEIKKFAPKLKIYIYHGQKRKFDFKGQTILLTSYGIIRNEINKFSATNWPTLIIDEAQNIKNNVVAQTKALKKIKADIRIALTGTPVENRLLEYWSIFDFLNRGYLFNLKKFHQEFAVPIEIERDRKQLEIFRKLTSPFILRRLKTDKKIINDLPEKIKIDQYVNLCEQQVALYQSELDITMKKLEKLEGMERRGLIFKLITSLKQICNHPANYQKKKQAEASISGKTSRLLEVLETIYENNEKVIIFTQYTQMGFLLEKMLQTKFEKEILFFHGGQSRKARDAVIDKFQNYNVIDTLILSLKAGGTGLNLTAAQNVIHFDLWWNPAVENQATDRAYRIGQKKKVMVQRLITKDTFEEKINEIINRKQELADLTVATGEKWIGEMSNQELKKIFELRQENANIY